MTVVSVESWQVVDKWWTAAPERREFIEVELVGGRRVTYVREEGGDWRIDRRYCPDCDQPNPHNPCQGCGRLA